MKLHNHIKKHILLYSVACFFILNIFNTYFLTTSTLNRYIVTFEHNFSSIVFSFFGNLCVLIIILTLLVIILKKPRKIAIALLVTSLILNICVFGLQIFNKSYKIAFSFYNFSLMKNPSGGFASNVLLDCLYELFIYYRILCFLPFIVGLILLIVYRNCFTTEPVILSIKKTLISIGVSLLIIISVYTNFQYSLNYIWKFSTDYAQYGCQYAGVYPYYISELLGIDNRKIDHESQPEQEILDLTDYNKNKSEYKNIIDGKTYSNTDKQTGILKGKNVYVFQLEAMMSFCFQSKYNDIEIMPYLNSLLEDENAFYFSNVFTTVGIGNTSDAEFAFFTGYYPTGDMTIAWEFAEYDFAIDSLGPLLTDYYSHSYNGTNENFYYHNNLHEELYMLDEFRGLETYESLYPRDEYAENYLNYWISDKSIFNWAAKNAQEANKNGQNSFAFVETITPHIPFNDLSNDLPNYTVHDFNIPFQYYQLTNYLNQVKYNDKLIYDFIMSATNPESEYYLEDTVFIIYGDHGNTLSKGGYEALLNRELTDLEYRRILLNIPFIVYDPSGSIKSTLNPNEIDSILTQVKSNTDIYRTIINLLGLNATSNYYGVNMFSGEPSYTYDPKNLDIITDQFIYNIKNEEYELYNDGELDQNIIEYISNYRIAQDEYLNSLVYSADKKNTTK